MPAHFAVRIFAMSDVGMRNYWISAYRIRQARELAKLTDSEANGSKASD